MAFQICIKFSDFRHVVHIKLDPQNPENSPLHSMMLARRIQGLPGCLLPVHLNLGCWEWVLKTPSTMTPVAGPAGASSFFQVLVSRRRASSCMIAKRGPPASMTSLAPASRMTGRFVMVGPHPPHEWGKLIEFTVNPLLVSSRNQ